MNKSILNWGDKNLDKRIDEKDFIDRKTLEGRVYHLMVQGMMLPTPEERHHAAMHIVIEVANGMYAACPGCGKRCEDTRCQSCKYKQQGILGNLQ